MTLFKLVPVFVFSLTSSLAVALEVKPYSEQEFTAAQASGKAVALHFHADWCPTCRAQAQVFNTLKNDKALNLTVLVANFDNEKTLKKQQGVRVQSTVIVFKGKQETARLAGDTAEGKIRTALQSAL